jgi:rhodanese-related sulfurtransferase
MSQNTINLINSTDLYQLLQLENQSSNQDLNKQVKITLIDVRNEAEFVEEHIPGAILLPLDRLTVQQVSPYKNQEWCIFYCRSGNRSHQAGEKLIQAGWTEVNHLQGGIQAWKTLGYPTTFLNP